jgi:hypothetical protein
MNKEVRTPRKKKEVELFVTRSGPQKGRPECEAAFLTKNDAVEFLVRLHGLDAEETKKLARERSLTLNPKWHGTEKCEFAQEVMSPAKARSALSGELYLAKVKAEELPTPRAISMKVTLNIKIRDKKSARKKPAARSKTAANIPAAMPKASAKKTAVKA